MTYQQKAWLSLTHTLDQRCGICWNDYLYDEGGICSEIERIRALVVDGTEDPDIPTGCG